MKNIYIYIYILFTAHRKYLGPRSPRTRWNTLLPAPRFANEGFPVINWDAVRRCRTIALCASVILRYSPIQQPTRKETPLHRVRRRRPNGSLIQLWAVRRPLSRILFDRRHFRFLSSVMLTLRWISLETRTRATSVCFMHSSYSQVRLSSSSTWYRAWVRLTLCKWADLTGSHL